jgi:PAS domain S-box-containing protein
MDTGSQLFKSPRKTLTVPTPISRRFSRLLAGAVCVVALLGFVSWAFGLPLLGSLLGGLSAMAVNTSYGLLGGALALLLHGIPGKAWSARVAGLVPAILGGLTMLQYLGGQDWGLHHALTPAGFIAAAFGPGNAMAPNTALVLALVGCSLVTLDLDRKGTTWPDFLVLSALFVALLMILGHLFEVRLLYGASQYIVMAIPTGLGLLALCAGILVLRMERNFLSVLQSSGASGTLSRLLLPLAISIPLVLAWLRFQNERFGIYGSTYIAVVVFLLAAFLAGLVLCAAQMISRLDEQRLLAEATLKELNGKLEHLVTKRTRELLESEDRFLQLVANSDNLFWFFEVGLKRVIFANSAFERLFYLPAEKINRDPGAWMTAAHPEDQKRIFTAWEMCLSGQLPGIEEEFRIIQPDGSTRWLLYSAIPIRNEAGEIVRVGNMARDITERKRAEIELSRVNRELRAINRCDQTLMRAVDEQTLLNDICRIICEEAGYRMARVGLAVDDDAKTIRLVAWAGFDAEYIAPPLTWADTECGQGPLGKAIRSGECSYVMDFETMPQMALWRETALRHGCRSCIALPLKDENASVFGVLQIYSTEVNAISLHEVQLLDKLSGDLAFGMVTLRTRDARKQAEEALRQSQESYASLFEYSRLGLYKSSIDHRILMANPAMCTMFGYASSEDLTKFDFENNPTYSRARFLEELARNSRVAGLESVWTKPNGETVILRESARPVHDISGELMFFEGIVEDISERKQTEAEILKLNRELEDKVAARTSDLEGANMALTLKEEEIHSVLDHIADCIITMDENGVIRSANQAVEKIFGYAVDELTGEKVSLLMPEFDTAAQDGYFDHYCRSGQHNTLNTGSEVKGIHKNGEPISLDLAISDYSIHGQRFFTCILRDIRERVRIISDLEQARHEAEQASQAKSAFLANMSHEIRTPMNGVIGMVDVLQQTSLKDYQVEMVDLIRESAFSLLSIIEDILDFSKIEAGRLEIERVPMLLTDVLEKTCAMMEGFAEKKRAELTLFVDPAIPEVVLGDALRLRQVLVNLISNAIKFSSGQQQPGRVSIRALLAGQNPGQAMVLFQVVDNGMGMDETTQMGLFTPFAQGNISISRRFGGTGLGLAITSHLVELMGGEIGVQSKPDQGSTFSVRLPFVSLPAKSGSPAADSPVDGLSCMVVGGLESQASDLATYLRSAGTVVEQAPDLKTAGERVGELSPGLWVWVIDASVMPASPEDFRAALVASPDIECRFVVIGRGQFRRRRRQRLRDSDLVTVDGNLLTRREIIKAVAIAAGRAKEDIETPVPRRGDTWISPPSRAESLRKGRLILLAEDNETNQKVYLQQLALLGFAADVASDGREALEYWNSGDYGLLLTDLNMSEMDGYELTAAIRAEEKGSRHLPIVALTANTLKGVAEQCRAAGMDDYLSKPTLLVDLHAMLERWLPAAESSPDLPGAQPPVAAAAGPVDVSVLKALVGGDPAVNQDFLHHFRVSAAKTAVELKATCENGLAARAGTLAHKLKSSARAMGALALGELCAEMEQAGKTGQVEALASLWLRFEVEMTAVDEYLRSL